MADQIYNFSAGPAMLPRPVLERARDELLSFEGSGMSIMEMSHRSKLFGEVLDRAKAGLRSLLSLPDNYRVLFVQGGATLQFSMVPMNFLAPGRIAEYVVTGHWGKKAVAAAKTFGKVNIAHNSEPTGFDSVPRPDEMTFDASAAYVHYTSNETIDGVEFDYDLDALGIPVVCDASSNILSKRIEVEKYALIYAGAQKNIGPSGVTVIIARDDMLGTAAREVPGLLTYGAIAAN